MATTALIVLLHLGPWELTLELGPPERCRATVFAYPGDRYVGGVAPALGRVPRGTDWLVAHRSLPLRSWVRVCRGSRCAWAPVMDRGPYMMRMADGAVVNAAHLPRVERTGRWRGCVDLTPPVAASIDLPGRGHLRAGRVEVRPLRLQLRRTPAPRQEV